jgi:hypothetical protein
MGTETPITRTVAIDLVDKHIDDDVEWYKYAQTPIDNSVVHSYVSIDQSLSLLESLPVLALVLHEKCNITADSFADLP